MATCMDTINVRYLMFSHAHLLREEGTLWALLVTVAGVVDGMGAGMQPCTGVGAGRGPGATRDRRIDHLSTAVTGKLFITCTKKIYHNFNV